MTAVIEHLEWVCANFARQRHMTSWRGPNAAHRRDLYAKVRNYIKAIRVLRREQEWLERADALGILREGQGAGLS